MKRSSLSATIPPKRLLLLFVVAASCWALLFPALNWPDEIYKVSRVGIDDNLYLDLLSWMSGGYCTVSYVYGEDISYLSNIFHVRMTNDGGCYYTLKLLNTSLLIGMVIAGLVLLRKSNLRTLFLLSLIWPAQVFYATSINQQTIFCVASIFIMTLVLTSARIVPYLALSIVLVLVDRSFVSLALYLAVLIALRWRPKLAPVTLVLVLVLAIFVRPYVESFNLFDAEGRTISDVSASLSDYHDSPIISLGLLFVSFVYLGGTNAIVGIGVDYAVVFITLGIWLWKAKGNVELRAYLYAFVFTYFILLSFVPTIQTFRYYVFLLPVLIHFLVRYEDRKRYYIGYCILMNIVYLAQAAIIYG